MTNEHNEKILSLCIPTYNRGERLGKLLRHIYGLSDSIKSRIQICVSDNCSSDITPEVINEWRDKLSLIVVRQETNIGLSRNFQAVVGLATTPWIFGMGDDDLLVEQGFENVLSVLDTLPSNTWVLGNVREPNGSTLLDIMSPGFCSIAEFKRKILFDSLFYSVGFISIHIMPREAVQRFSAFKSEPIPGWPNLALLFHVLKDVQLYVEKECVVVRMGDGSLSQTWRAKDWLRVVMEKIKLSCRSEHGQNLFSTALAMREYMSWDFSRQTLFSAMVTGEKRQLRQEINSYLDATNIHSMARLIIKVFIFILLLFPIGLIAFARKLRNPAAEDASKLEKVVDEKDGMNRGI
ncbi:MAG: glycosyltransferase family 2 protein [Gallionella sp.]|nr:glycosyltransferase family 2 protein [Gallionella sp.]MDD4946159.1 glycosyltransferase family 2 protein [Gallionella sp.]